MLPTGNGHGFHIYDEAAGRLAAFMDHPYRYLRAPKDLTVDGPESRNILEDLTLGADDGGLFSGWEREAVEYSGQSNIIRTALRSGQKRAEAYYFSPFGLEMNALLALAHVPSGGGTARLKFSLGANAASPDVMHRTLKVERIAGERIQKIPGAWVQTGNGKGAVVFIPVGGDGTLSCAAAGEGTPPAVIEGETVCSGGVVSAEMRLPAKDGWFGLLAAYVEEPAQAPAAVETARRWLAGRAPQDILKDSLSEWEAWRKPALARLRGEDETKTWRQSEAVLRMAQVREPNIRKEGALRVNNGMILASLPPGCWATGWVRDGAYATAALARMGHWKEAKASLNFFLNAEPVGKFKSYAGNSDYRISLTRYYGSGEEEADHSGLPQPNIEFDDWGLFLWAAGQYVKASGDAAWLSEPTRKGSVYEAMRDGVAKPLEENLEPPPLPRILQRDSSIWEVHGNARHYAFSNIAAIRGLSEFADMARKTGHADDALKYSRLAGEMRADFEKCFAGADGGLLGALERSPGTDLDGAVVEAVSLEAVNPKGRLAKDTLDKLQKLRTRAGGYKRNGGSDDYDVNNWIFIDLRMAGAFYRSGRRAEADALLNLATGRAAANFNLLPEEYNVLDRDGPVGAYIGSIPMVGYGAGVYALSLLDRDNFR